MDFLLHFLVNVRKKTALRAMIYRETLPEQRSHRTPEQNLKYGACSILVHFHVGNYRMTEWKADLDNYPTPRANLLRDIRGN